MISKPKKKCILSKSKKHRKSGLNAGKWLLQTLKLSSFPCWRMCAVWWGASPSTWCEALSVNKISWCTSGEKSWLDNFSCKVTFVHQILLLNKHLFKPAKHVYRSMSEVYFNLISESELRYSACPGNRLCGAKQSLLILRKPLNWQISHPYYQSFVMTKE